MTNQQIPAEYAWIKPGVTVVYINDNGLGMQICSSPFQQESGEWMAHYTNAEENGRVNCDFIKPFISAEQTLAKARAVLAEHREGVVWAQNVKAYPSIENESALKCLVALADALEGGGDE